jgi:hypothetical protein
MFKNMKSVQGSLLLTTALVLTWLVPMQASADTFDASYLAPGVQTPSGITTHYETFDNNFNGTSTFGGSSVTGTYSGYTLSGATEYGGAGGSGDFIEAQNLTSYTLSLSSSINYFGLWFSALDQGNELQFYNNGSLLYTFSPANYAALVGTCPTSASEPNYCGNPNADFYEQDAGEQFAYLNFYDSNGTFNKVVFTETTSIGAFESDNQAVATLTAPPNGTTLTSTPEPASWVYGITGLIGVWLAMLLKRRNHEKRQNLFSVAR